MIVKDTNLLDFEMALDFCSNLPAFSEIHELTDRGSEWLLGLLWTCETSSTTQYNQQESLGLLGTTPRHAPLATPRTARGVAA